MRKLFNLYKKHKKNHILRNTLFVCLSLGIIFIGIILIWISSFKIPDLNSFEERRVENSTKIYDRTGEIILYDIHKNAKRTDIRFNEMGVNIKNATVAIEDAEFYNHNGIRITSIIRAILANLLGTSRTQGGSTITQQLIKNTLLTQEKSYTRKIKEWVLAVKLDKAMSKEKILEYYLNEAPYGGNVYGIQEASRTYFNKDAINLSLAEAGYLAAIPQSPTSLSPFRKNRDKLEARKNLVFSRMFELGFITEEEYNIAKSEVVTFIPQNTQGIKAPHFVFFIKEYLEEKYGTEIVEKGGLKVTTTLDYTLQEKGEQIVKNGALKNAKDWNGENAALVAIDPKTGQIITMIGSRDYFDKEIDGNFNVTTASRQPGSSFKPFIYATAFNKGFTSDTVLFDLATEFQTTCDAYGKAFPDKSQADCYMPQNYDGKFRGPMTLRDALGQSINVIAVKLLYLAGLKDSLKTAEDMGINTLTDPGRYGLTLVIGGGEVTLLEITSAYSVFANDGNRNPYTGILKVEDPSGNILEEFTAKPQNILPKNTALTISNILNDEKARIPTFGIRSVLYIPNRDVAVKTGTTNNNKDAWTIGYTPSISVGVWAGNNDNTPMKKGGVSMAGPIWNKFINEALKTLPNEKFENPDLGVDPVTTKPVLRGSWLGNDNFFIDKISGKLATEFTPRETLEEKIITNVHSILYWVDKNNITGPAPKNDNDRQFSHFDIPIQNWWAQNRYKYKVVTENEKPSMSDDVHTESNKPVVKIIEPNQETTYLASQKINIKLTSAGNYPLLKADIFINDVYVGENDLRYGFSFTPKDLENIQEKNELKIIVYDTVYNSTIVTTTFSVKD